jgi:hypothetical protein
MDTETLLWKLKLKLDVSSDEELADMVGVSIARIKSWYKREELTESIVADLIIKAVDKGGEILLKNSIKPIVEFYQTNQTLSKRGSKYEILTSDAEEDSYEVTMKNYLNKHHGIYIFYNSTGHVIYAGKALKQSLWVEMNSAFNRDRSNSQSAYLVIHDVKEKNFVPAFEKPRSIENYSVLLHDVAHYFSAYLVCDPLINNLEAFLIRAIPNDITNTRMERIKGWEK